MQRHLLRPSMRVVIFQGQYGVFPVRGLSLSMPAVQTCIGMHAIHASGATVLAAHFDTDLELDFNLDAMQNALPRGQALGEYDVVLFGGDGMGSLLRCGAPSAWIGAIIEAGLRRRGCSRVRYSNQYSGVIPRTFNLTVEHERPCIVEGERHEFFSGFDIGAKALTTRRINKRPAEYLPSDARMVNVSSLYRKA